MGAAVAVAAAAAGAPVFAAAAVVAFVADHSLKKLLRYPLRLGRHRCEPPDRSAGRSVQCRA